MLTNSADYGKLKQMTDSTSSVGLHVALGVLTQAVASQSGGCKVGVYTGGFFNEAALVWPTGLTTLAKRRARFQGTTVNIGTIGK
jgi:hypothetical protein